MYWRANCTKEDSGTNSQENILMGSQNGFSSESLGRLAPPTDPAPSYDEVMGRKVDNQLHTK
ncbi:hypothetical protein TcasGA2_TC011096 [Tribolium castaneum]|uniref:Uncharacterized protein n=1 Tax=Tribolium castaneum TaxID=7070 RepID=D6X4B9_TRICA|nr:hypothetical protein TcasGA2_TC011096 [Tribolium castaneum]